VVRWGKRGAWINAISPGIIITRLPRTNSPDHAVKEYRRMIQVRAAGHAGTPNEVGSVGALLMGPDDGFITGSDILRDSGVSAAHRHSELASRVTG
jgi:NAD(P)-dependent dehydrogenase (short-subunit alcohol dehydrogenase family)